MNFAPQAVQCADTGMPPTYPSITSRRGFIGGRKPKQAEGMYWRIVRQFCNSRAVNALLSGFWNKTVTQTAWNRNPRGAALQVPLVAIALP